MEPVTAYNNEIPNKETPDANPAERMNLTPASLEILFDVSQATNAATGKVDNSNPI